MKIAFAKPGLPDKGVVVVGVLEGRKPTPSAARLDQAMQGGLSRAMEASRFEGKKDQAMAVLAPAGLGLDRIHVVGLGKAEKLDSPACQSLGGQIWAALSTRGADRIEIAIDAIDGAKLPPAAMAAEIAFGARLRSYRFDKYMTRQKKEDKPTLKQIRLLCDGFETAKASFAILDRVADGVFLTRDLVTEPANVLTPEVLADRARDELEPLGVEVEILDRKAMKKLGMGALLGVAQGSANEPCMVVMQWHGAGKPDKGKKAKGDAPIAFVGKGVTFDTGGISIKPSAGMEEMKWDMGGAGVVIGLMKALAGRQAKSNVVGVVGLVENMPSGTAQRPGDVVNSMSGQTIEVLNTDAEGRLVLADALWYTKERFKPRFMVDLATLTGAMIICLGHEMAGVFANDDALADALVKAGLETGENLWRLPLGEEYDKMLKSDIADMKNISGGRGAGSITAAQFLQRFVDKTDWAHIDIAGVTWSKKDSATCPKGGTAFGVRLLDRLIAANYEKGN